MARATSRAGKCRRGACARRRSASARSCCAAFPPPPGATTDAFVAGSPYLDSDAVFGVKESLVREVVDGVLTFDVTLLREG